MVYLTVDLESRIKRPVSSASPRYLPSSYRFHSSACLSSSIRRGGYTATSGTLADRRIQVLACLYAAEIHATSTKKLSISHLLPSSQ
ncbi:hypothetical protein CC2G_012978 [Coprinopsis cinerea AmutBmut pab1-1]|nr:hypothetical protein CC2G_012978 [Coprinopsis cinerea AmutBmut pab1-1]